MTRPAASHLSAPISEASGASHWPLSSTRAAGAAAATAWRRARRARDAPPGVEVDVDQRGHRNVAVDAAGAEPGLEQGLDLGVGHRADIATTRAGCAIAAAAAAAWARRTSGLASTIWMVTRQPICSSSRAAAPPRPEPGGGGEHGQEHHDRDDPGHRPGDPPLGEQAALGARRTCARRPSCTLGPPRRMAQRAGRIGDLAAVEPQHLGAPTPR